MSDDDTLARTISNRDGTCTAHDLNGSHRVGKSRAPLRSMTEGEIWESALADVDNPPLTDEELERLSQPNRFREVRQQLGLTPFQFAERFGIPTATVLAWETGQESPDPGSLVLLQVIGHDPDAVIRAIHSRAAD